MDIIGQLIKNKKNMKNASAIANNIIDEIIKYEKLSRSPKFKSIVESEVLQKQLPEIWKAFNNDTQNMYLFENAVAITQEITNRPLQVYVDFHNHYDKKDLKKLSIIGSNIDYQFQYMQLEQYYLNDNDNVTYITEDTSDGQNIVVIVWGEKTAYVYHGHLKNNTDVMQEIQRYKHEPYVYTKSDICVTIKNFSSLGNNNYPFGRLSHKDETYAVRISGNTIYFNDDYSSEISEEDLNTLHVTGDVHVLSEIIVKSYKEVKR